MQAEVFGFSSSDSREPVKLSELWTVRGALCIRNTTLQPCGGAREEVPLRRGLLFSFFCSSHQNGNTWCKKSLLASRKP